jgi:hypothetical protein
MAKKKKNPYLSDRNPFDEVKALFSKDQPRFEIVRPFMVIKILSFLASKVLFAIKINEQSNGMPKWLMNMILNVGVPKINNIPYLNTFPKRQAKTDVLLRAKIAETFCTSPYHSNQIIDLLRMQDEKPEEYFGLREGE